MSDDLMILPENMPGDILHNQTIWTPEIDRFAENVAGWIRMDLPGGAVCGYQRNGKSRACRYLIGGLPEILGYPIAVVYWTIPEQLESKKNEREFIQEMLQQSGCPKVVNKDLAVLRRRCYTHLCELAIGAGSRRIVIIIDEAQNLTRFQYAHLIHCYNSLEQFGVRPFFLLVGQPDLQNSVASWRESTGLQVIGRFFSREHRFLGISLDEFEEVLEAFDMPLEDGGRSTLDSVFPTEYAQGWSLNRLNDPFVEAFKAVLKQHNIVGTLRVPMQYFRSALLNLLYRARDNKFPLTQLDSARVFTAIQDTQFFNVMQYYVDDSRAASVKQNE